MHDVMTKQTMHAPFLCIECAAYCSAFCTPVMYTHAQSLSQAMQALIHRAAYIHKLTASSCEPFRGYPPDGEHADVMVDMKKSYLTVLFTEDEKECVQKFY